MVVGSQSEVWHLRIARAAVSHRSTVGAAVGPAVAEGGSEQALAAARRGLTRSPDTLSEMSAGLGWAGLVVAMLDRIEALLQGITDEQFPVPVAARAVRPAAGAGWW